ncbi:MAG: SRPBCC domain-containing protein, partial [Phormidesmis sp.]
MPTLYAEIDINAPQSVVWDALIRKDQWRFWNTFLYDCDPGLTLARGNEIFLSMQRLEGDEETEFQPVITMMRSPYLMKWVSTIPGLRSEHVF